MVMDVESIGLHGESFAVGFVVIDPDGDVRDHGCFACAQEAAPGSDADRQWVAEHIPAIKVTHPDPQSVRRNFYLRWLYWKGRGALLAADCPWPVEARFLCQMMDEMGGDPFLGPYPLIDVGSLVYAIGLDPLCQFKREEDELPIHHPLADARQSARVLYQAIHRVGEFENYD